LVTYLLEGRINLLQEPTVAGRYTYVLIANVLIGTFGAVWLLRSFVSSKLVTLAQLGFRSIPRIIGTGLIALALGFGLLLLDPPPSLTPLIVLNGFAQTLPVSIAEIIVCWLMIGVIAEQFSRPAGKWLALAAGIIAADVFFSLYHAGHSAPFNQVGMMLTLLIPGFLTALFFFISRELYATIIFHNFLATIGVLRSLTDLTFMSQPLYPLYLLVLISLLGLIVVDMFVMRRTKQTYQEGLNAIPFK
jgi:hypothetical protein